MKFLSLDASTKFCVACLSDNNGLIYGTRRLFEKGRCEAMLGLIEHCLEKAKLKKKEIDYFGVGVGPGSFTGLRIGLSTIKGLSYALKKPCLAFSSLDAIAFNRASYRKNEVYVLVDARRSKLYNRFYKFNGASGEIEPASEGALTDFEDLAPVFSGKMAFSGDALGLYKDEISRLARRSSGTRKGAGSASQFMPEELWYPTAESISYLTRRSYLKGETIDCFKLSAAYLYEQDCQVHPVREIH